MNSFKQISQRNSDDALDVMVGTSSFMVAESVLGSDAREDSEGSCSGSSYNNCANP